MTLISASKDFGPYLPADTHRIPVGTLADMLSNVRNLMDLEVDKIAVFDDNGQCKAIWIDEAEPEPDGEGGFFMPSSSYTLYRANQLSEKMMTIYCSSLPR